MQLYISTQCPDQHIIHVISITGLRKWKIYKLWPLIKGAGRPEHYSRIVHVITVLKSMVWLKGGFVVMNLHLFFSGLYIWISKVDLFLGILRWSDISGLCIAVVSTYNSPFIATNEHELLPGIFFRKLDSFIQRFKTKSYLQKKVSKLMILGNRVC